MARKTIFLGADHAGFKLKEAIKPWLFKSYNIKDLGNLKLESKDDYPDYASKVAKAVVRNKALGILICGSGHGTCIVANKISGARAVAINNTRDAKITREHNDANIICLSGWNTRKAKAKKLINIFLTTKFTKDKRHVRRLKKIKHL